MRRSNRSQGDVSRCAAVAGHRSPGKWLPGRSVRFQSANPRDLAVKNGDDGRPLSTSKLPFAGISGQSTSPQVLLAMQKVVGSNPISRF